MTPQLRPYIEEMPIENLICKPNEFEVKWKNLLKVFGQIDDN